MNNADKFTSSTAVRIVLLTIDERGRCLSRKGDIEGYIFSFTVELCEIAWKYTIQRISTIGIKKSKGVK